MWGSHQLFNSLERETRRHLLFQSIACRMIAKRFLPLTLTLDMNEGEFLRRTRFLFNDFVSTQKSGVRKRKCSSIETFITQCYSSNHRSILIQSRSDRFSFSEHVCWSFDLIMTVRLHKPCYFKIEWSDHCTTHNVKVLHCVTVIKNARRKDVCWLIYSVTFVHFTSMNCAQMILSSTDTSERQKKTRSNQMFSLENRSINNKK